MTVKQHTNHGASEKVFHLHKDIFHFTLYQRRLKILSLDKSAFLDTRIYTQPMLTK